MGRLQSGDRTFPDRSGYDSSRAETGFALPGGRKELYLEHPLGFEAEKKRRKELADMSPESKAVYTATKSKKRKQEFRMQYEEERKLKYIKTVKTDSREETHEDFKEGLYLSRSRIIDKKGGNNPTAEDVTAADKHILHATKKAGTWLLFFYGGSHGLSISLTAHSQCIPHDLSSTTALFVGLRLVRRGCHTRSQLDRNYQLLEPRSSNRTNGRRPFLLAPCFS